MKYKTKILVAIILLIVAIGVAYAVESYFEIIQLESKVIRLHILANSDTIQDQELKLKVRNNVIKEFNGKFKNIVSKNESEKIILENINKIKEIAQKTVYDEGYTYNVEVYYGNYKFSSRDYDNFTLPEGEYDAVRIEIGSAQGKNWWCVMFPPLCFVDFGKAGETEVLDEEIEDRLKQVLTEEEIEIIKTNRGYSKIKLKSKLYELISSALNKLN